MIAFAFIFILSFSISIAQTSNILGNIRCSEDRGTCWCVNPGTESELPGTNRPIGTGLPHCKTCVLLKRQLAAQGATSVTNIPQCSPAGFYERLQCTDINEGSSCRCAHQITGELNDDTRYGPDQLPYCEQFVAQANSPRGERRGGKLLIQWDLVTRARTPPFILHFSPKRSAPLEKWQQIIVMPADISEAGDSVTVDDFLNEGKLYWVRVQALSRGGLLGPLSDKGKIPKPNISATTAPGLVTILEAKRVENPPGVGVRWERPNLVDSVANDLNSWTYTVYSAAGYRKESSLPDNAQSIDVAGNKSSVVITGVQPQNDVTVWIRAANRFGLGPLSPGFLVPGTSLAQCNQQLGQCHCVNQTTRQPLPWTIRTMGTGVPHCFQCQVETMRLMTLPRQVPAPVCTPSGFFAKIQCNKPAKYCLCVNQVTGQRHIATTSPLTQTPDCSNDLVQPEVLGARRDPLDGSLDIALNFAPEYIEYYLQYSMDSQVPDTNSVLILVPEDQIMVESDQVSIQMSNLLASNGYHLKVIGVTGDGYLSPSSDPIPVVDQATF